MLKELLRLTEESTAVSKEMQLNITKTRIALEKELKSWFERGEKVQVQATSANSARYTIEFNYWMRPETILDVAKTAEEVVRAAKIPGELFKVEVDHTGEYAVEAMLGGIRRGIMIKSEAFFPDFEIDVIWKNIVSRGSKKL